MHWLILVVAGFLEVVFAFGLKLTEGQMRPLIWMVSIVALTLSVTFLATAMRSIPLATAYVVWTGIGAVGTFILSALYFSEPVNAMKLASVACIVVGLVGLKSG